MDGSTPVGHGTQAAWVIQQLLNTSLSSTLCGCSQVYNQTYYNEVLGENFVQITGPLTFTIHVMNPNSAFLYLIGNSWGFILAPNYVMQKDLALWTSSSSGYQLPFSNVSGGMTNQIDQYFQDLLATCNTGITQSGCGTTYLDGSYSGSNGGTGPYTIQSFDSTTNVVTLTSNTNYWGGPYQYQGGQKIVPKISTIVFKYVPDQSTRDIDLQNAATSGQAMAIDVTNTRLYDIADRNTWLNSNSLKSNIPGVSIYGPYSSFATLFDPFSTNVTDPYTGTYYTFQPFADARLRLAFADSVNLSDIDQNVNNKLGQVANNMIPPGLPPSGSYNSSIKPSYSFNPYKVQTLLLNAMMHPLTQFNFVNGSTAPPGIFNNTFGCSALNSANQCGKPVSQSVQLVYQTGDSVSQAIFEQIASAINNVSATYNMGLTVSVLPIPAGQELSQVFSSTNPYYMYNTLGWFADYPWIMDFLGGPFAPGQAYTGPDSVNISSLSQLYNEATVASQEGNISGILSASNQMNTIANNMTLYLWTFYPEDFVTMTSNIQGFYFNPSLGVASYGGVGPEYFATLY